MKGDTIEWWVILGEAIVEPSSDEYSNIPSQFYNPKSKKEYEKVGFKL